MSYRKNHCRVLFFFFAPALLACGPIGGEPSAAGGGQSAASTSSGAGGTSGQGGGGGMAGQSSASSASSAAGPGSTSSGAGQGSGGAGGGVNSPFSMGPPTTSEVFAFSDLELADLDGDGCADLVLAGTGSPPRLEVYESACDGTFPGPPFVQTLTTFDDFALGDVDGDGRADVFTRDAGSPPRISVRKSGDAFTLGAAVTTQVWTYDGLWVGDVNGDGRADALSTHFGANPPTIYAWSGPGDGSLSALSSVTPQLFDAGAFFGDLLIGKRAFVPSVRFLHGDPSGALTIGPAQEIFDFSALSLGDLDGDGDADLLTDVPGNDWVISLFPNEGGSFGPPTLFQGLSYGALRSADVDGDGRSDVVVAPKGAPPRVTVWRSQAP